MRRVVKMEEEESNYVNIQYFLNHTKSRSKLDREKSLENGEESDEENENEVKSAKSPNNNTSNSNGGSLGSNKSRDNSSGVGEAERQLMYRHILNSIADSEAIYLECLSVSLQYMKV